METRYRRLLGEAAWARLRPEVRCRFSKIIGREDAIVYQGTVAMTRLSFFGRLIAHAARLVGAPIPLAHGATGPSVVTVTLAPGFDGHVYSRQYPGPGCFPQVIHSAKRFTGPTGLEEVLGGGLLMRLTVHEVDGGLAFRSAGYAIEIGGITVALPRWLWPGRCEVRHQPETDERFSFTLTLDHPWLGRLVHQVAFFADAPRQCHGSNR